MFLPSHGSGVPYFTRTKCLAKIAGTLSIVSGLREHDGHEWLRDETHMRTANLQRYDGCPASACEEDRQYRRQLCRPAWLETIPGRPMVMIGFRTKIPEAVTGCTISQDLSVPDETRVKICMADWLHQKRLS